MDKSKIDWEDQKTRLAVAKEELIRLIDHFRAEHKDCTFDYFEETFPPKLALHAYITGNHNVEDTTVYGFDKRPHFWDRGQSKATEAILKEFGDLLGSWVTKHDLHCTVAYGFNGKKIYYIYPNPHF